MVTADTAKTFQLPSDNWSHLKSDILWDLIVVGGGITGAAVVNEAARGGLRVLLIEQQDFAWGSSSRTSKMVHGGLRYLTQGQWKLTRDSLQERERLVAEVPGLVNRMGYFYTLSKHTPPRFAVKAALWLYDIFSGRGDHYYVSPQNLSFQFNGISERSVHGAYFYSDATVDDSRLVLRLLHDAKARGATLQNYVKAKSLHRINNEVSGVVAVESSTGESCILRSKVVISATGAWADELRSELVEQHNIKPQRGSHLLLSARRLPLVHAITLHHPDDGRFMFMYPWAGKTVIGTTDLNHREDIDIEASITVAELDYLLRAANHLFPQANLGREDVMSTWAGVRPIVAGGRHKAPSKQSRSHAIWQDGNLITVSGGKLTTFRIIARDTLKFAKALLPELKLEDNGRVFSRSTVTTQWLFAANCELAEVFLGRYGDLAKYIVQLAIDTGREAELLPIEDTYFCLAECRWALKAEQVQHLDDLLLRRTHLGLLLPHGGRQLFGTLQQLFAEELSWDAAKWSEEKKRYTDIYQRYYSLPE